jgi:hypothetical protein
MSALSHQAAFQKHSEKTASLLLEATLGSHYGLCKPSSKQIRRGAHLNRPGSEAGD